MDKPLIDPEDDDAAKSGCWCWRRRRRRRSHEKRFEVLRRLTELKAALRAKMRINQQHANAALEEAKRARREGRKDDALLHMRRSRAFHAANRQHSQILINLEVRQVQVENDPSAVADALVQINALPAPPTRSILVESPPPPLVKEKTKRANAVVEFV